MPGELLADPQRRPVTVLFTDLSGYTALSEALDPEEVQEVMARIFGGVARIAAEYEGHIEKFIGDAVMILFGVPRVHEDDAVRAIKTAQEIHTLVERMSPEFQEAIGRPLSMHSGANTGVIVASEFGGGSSESFLGDAINVAARLSETASAGKILVGESTHRQAGGSQQQDFGPGASLQGGGGTEHTGQTIYALIVASEQTKADAQGRREDARSALGEFETYFIVDRSDHYAGMRSGWWVVFEPYRTRADAVSAMQQTKGWLDNKGIESYVKRVTVRCRDRFTLVEDQSLGD